MNRVKKLSLKRGPDAQFAPRLGEVKPLLRPSRPHSPPDFWVALWRRIKMWRCCPRRSKGCVRFRGSVRVLSFPRALCGGDAVPTDGSTVALGLGRTPAESEARLAGPRPQSDQISWMPTEMRERVLVESMGKEGFAKAQELHLAEMTQVIGQRQSSAQDDKDMVLMPQSLEEACHRARELTDEVAALHREARRQAALRRLDEAPSPKAQAAPAPGKKTRSPGFGKARLAAKRKVRQVRHQAQISKQQLKEAALKDVVACSPARARCSLPAATES